MKLLRGFTMIEILVVVAIIGVLAAVMLAGFNPVRSLERARDASRIADVKAIAKAQEVYYPGLTEYSNIGSNGGADCADGANQMAGVMDEVPVSSNTNFPYTCDQNNFGVPQVGPPGFCISVELQATEGNCTGCNCVAGGTACTMNVDAVPANNIFFCVTQQQ